MIRNTDLYRSLLVSEILEAFEDAWAAWEDPESQDLGEIFEQELTIRLDVGRL